MLTTYQFSRQKAILYNLEPGDKPPRVCNLTVPRKPIRTRIKELPRFVTVKGGYYFFLPGLTAIRFLAAMPATGS